MTLTQVKMNLRSNEEFGVDNVKDDGGDLETVADDSLIDLDDEIK